MEAAPAPTRQWTIDGRRIALFDGLLPNVGDFVRGLDAASFSRTEVARPETAEHRHWASPIRIEALLPQPLYATTMGALRQFDPATTYQPYRAYTNVAGFGDMLFTHVDCLPGQGDLTALWYMCDRWDVEWGGETVFLDADGEIAASILPRPGRLVIFDGALRHAGRPPARICYVPRYTLAIKFEPVAMQGPPRTTR